jgi:drug/metabolite transporter (DMT)-like permease
MTQLILAMVIWGTLGLVVLKSGLGSTDIAFYRCLVGAAILIPYCWYKGYFKATTLTLKTTSMILLGGIFIVLNWILLFQSFKLASITLGNISYYVQPVFLVVLGRFFFKENVTFIKWAFILLTLCGVFMTMDIPLHDFHIHNSQCLGVCCALLAGFFYSIATIIVKKTNNVLPTMTTLLQLMMGTIVLFPFAHPFNHQVTWSNAIYIAVFGLVYTVIAFILYYSAVKKLPTTSIAVISYVDPIVAIITDVFFFDKTLSIIQIFGIVLTLASSYFVINIENFRLLKNNAKELRVLE